MKSLTIKGFVFEDCINIYGRIDRNYLIKNAGNSKRTQKFKVVLEIDDIRTMAFAICDILLAVGRATYHIEEGINDFY